MEHMFDHGSDTRCVRRPAVRAPPTPGPRPVRAEVELLVMIRDQKLDFLGPASAAEPVEPAQPVEDVLREREQASVQLSAARGPGR